MQYWIKYLLTGTLITTLDTMAVHARQTRGIYHEGWINFNKNGRKDIFEDSLQPIDARIQDLLSQMTLEEKT